MGKFDGMDPQLVRELLAEVKQAATQLRTTEARVAQVMTRAGLATQTTHRPVQVAEAADTMVKDVNDRLGLLEKKADRPRGDSAPTVGADGKPADEPKEQRDGRSRDDNPRTDPAKPAEDTPKTGDDAKTGDQAKRSDDVPKSGDDAKSDKPSEDAKTGDQAKRSDDVPKTGDDAKSGDGKPSEDGSKACDDAKTGDQTKPSEDARTGDQTKPSDDVPKTGDDAAVGDEPKDDDRDSRRDRGAESDGQRVDTPAKDHPDDSDPHKPQVIEVDGVKVLQVPIDPPTAEQLRELLENIDNVQPIDMPSPGGDGQSPDASNGTGTGTSDVSKWANDGSDVVSAEAGPLDMDGLRTVVDHARDIQPLDLPGVEVPSGEYGKGEWAAREIRPDGPAGTIAPATPADASPAPPVTDTSGGATAVADSSGGTTAVTDTSGGTTAIPNPGDSASATDTSGGDGCSPADPTPGRDSPADAQPDRGAGVPPDRGSDADGGGVPDRGADARADREVGVPPDRGSDADGGGVPDRGADARADREVGVQPDRGSDADGDGAPERGSDGGGGTEQGEPVVIDPTPPAGTGDAPPAAGTGDAPVAGGEAAGQSDGDGRGAGVESDATRWANDGSDVVSAEAAPLDLDGLRTLMTHAREVEPLDMPGVEVPAGEYGRGEWAPRHVEPDGPPGAVDPGPRERSE